MRRRNLRWCQLTRRSETEEAEDAEDEDGCAAKSDIVWAPTWDGIQKLSRHSSRNLSSTEFIVQDNGCQYNLTPSFHPVCPLWGKTHLLFLFVPKTQIFKCPPLHRWWCSGGLEVFAKEESDEDEDSEELEDPNEVAHWWVSGFAGLW